MAAEAPLPTGLKGALGVEVPALTAGAQGVSGFSANVSLANGLVQMKELASDVRDITADITATQDVIEARRVSCTTAGGSVEASGTVRDYLGRQEYDLIVDGKNINLADLLDQKAAPVQAEGIVSVRMKMQGRGFTPEALKSGLSGTADLSLGKGKLKNVNVLRAVLDKISILPGLAQNLEAGLPGKWKEKLKQKDTVLSDLKLPMAIENGRLSIKDAVVGADEFLFKGMGEAGFDGGFLAEGTFLIPQDLSAALVAQVSQLQYLLNSEKQIYLPLRVSGKGGGAPSFSVDADYIAKQLLQTQAKQQIFKAIDKALGGGEKQEQPESADQQPQGDAQEQKPSTEGAVKDLLRGIFK